MIKVRYMGGNLMFLTPRDGEWMDEIIKENREWFDSVMEVIEPWMDGYVAIKRVVLFRCYGLSFSL